MFLRGDAINCHDTVKRETPICNFPCTVHQDVPPTYLRNHSIPMQLRHISVLHICHSPCAHRFSLILHLLPRIQTCNALPVKALMYNHSVVRDAQALKWNTAQDARTTQSRTFNILSDIRADKVFCTQQDANAINVCHILYTTRNHSNAPSRNHEF